MARWRQLRSRIAPGVPSERLELTLALPDQNVDDQVSGPQEDQCGVRLSGTIAATDHRGGFMFIGTIAPGCVRKMSDYGLSIGDFGPADPTPEFAMMAEVNAGMLADSQLMNQQLKAAHDQMVSAKQELERKNRFLGTIMECMPVSLAIRDARTRQFVLINRTIDPALTPDDCLGKTFFELHPHGKAQELTALDNQALDNPNESTADAFFIGEGDQKRLVHQRLKAVPGPDGEAEFILTMLEDVTDRWRTLEDLRVSEASLKRSQSMAKIGSWHYRFGSNEVVWSDQMYILWGHKPGGFQPTRAAILARIDGQDRPKVIKAIVETLRQREPVEVMFRLIPETGNPIQILLDVECEFDERRELSGLFGTCQDITDRIEAEEQIWHLACQDALTGLPNRSLFSDRLEFALSRAERENISLAVHCLDLNDFKGVNDTLGHAVGDELLRQVAGRLSATLRSSDTVARLGGDEFAIIQTPIRSIDDAKQLSERVIETLDAPYRIGDHNVFTSASVGIALCPDHGDSSEQLLRFADTALYQAKDVGRGNYRFFSSDMERHLSYRKSLESDLRQALDDGQFSLHFQPQYCMRSGTLLGAEALIRWQHPKLGWIPPDEFVPIAEEIGQVLAIGRYVLRTACREARKWVDGGKPDLRVAVNLSPAQFAYQDLLDTVLASLEETQLPPQNLELEITETMLMRDREATMSTLRDLCDLGVSLALDDFGTGYSSLSYLRKFQIDKIKIDRSFITDVPYNSDDMTLVRTILTLGHSLGLRVAAEGVETQAQYDFLVERGCDEAQGFLMSRPMPSEAFLALVEADINAPAATLGASINS
jgi:diguanylate cyclase (GGDEF)-like protein